MKFLIFLDVESLRYFVKTIPRPNQVLLKYLSSFLCSIASYEAFNKMSLSNLATVFGPNLLYPRYISLNNGSQTLKRGDS